MSVPPSLPTGTVSQTSAGTRTFPPESDRARAPAASTESSRPQQAQTPPSTPSPGSVPSAVVPRREHDAAVSREHDRVEQLKRENRALREYIESKADDRQAVIERYERLIDQRNASAARAESRTRTQSPSSSRSWPSLPSPSAGGLTGAVDTLRSVVATAGSRLTARFSRD